LIGTASAGVGLWLLATNRPRAAGVALTAAALTLPTGFAFGLYLVVIVSSVPLIVVGSGTGEARHARAE
jgi:hypothetical protein